VAAGDKRSLLERAGLEKHDDDGGSRLVDAHFRPDSQRGVENRIASGFWNLIKKAL